ncbi:PP2C family protein-serine/threonine phosphatase [Rubrobacter indicoceani]|uniref:PP2C family protein-serine/threonine phosphatase n=1 Tax=Rubrobacter indicoceani TaxID=2051957 RepID=UPI000E5C5325|nr:SpoIIE family protein phosphatase [Rubrobacter indicoceani]
MSGEDLLRPAPKNVADLGFIIEGMCDPVALLDRDWQFTYLNPAAVRVLGGDLVGEKVWERFPGAVGSELNLKLLAALETGEAAEVLLRPREFGLETEAWFRLRAYPSSAGVAVIAWDATEMKLMEEEREKLLRSSSETSRALQTALLPPALPEIEGIEVGAEYEAVGEGLRVGGDFYDVFAIENDGWAFVIGDVTGKGPEAASLTSFARYTVRALAMRLKKPEAVLGALNREILLQTDGERLFSAVYGELAPGVGEATLRISCAGHPSPLVLRAGGEVEWLPETGMILGEVEEPEFSSHEFLLGRGEAMIFYTDGVTEARNPSGRFFGEEAFIKTVSASVGLTAPDVARKLKERVLRFQDGSVRDDVAVLVVRVGEQETHRE